MTQTLPRSFESALAWTRIFYNLRKLRRNTWLSPTELEKLQNKKLRKIVTHAYENVAFYHQAFRQANVKPSDIMSADDLLKIPPVTKSQIQKNTQSFIANGISLEECITGKTSGSTGVPLTVYAQKNDSCILKADELRHYVENGGSLLRDKFVLIGYRRLPVNRSNAARFLNQLGMYRNTRLCLQDPIVQILEQLDNYKPDVIKAPMSVLMLLAKEMKQSEAEIRPKFVWSNGELVDPAGRKLVNSAFDVEMLDGYACMETGYVAWECSEHLGYHINKDFVVTEFIKDDEHVAAGEAGEIILTSLWNFAMPLIRYRVGDVGTPSDETCPCGRGLPLMKVVEGRLDDFIALPSGKIISPIVIMSVFDGVEGIIEFRVIQERKEELDVQIVAPSMSEIELHRILDEKFAERLREPIELNIERVNALERARDQEKPRCIISKCLPREHFLT